MLKLRFANSILVKKMLAQWCIALQQRAPQRYCCSQCL